MATQIQTSQGTLGVLHDEQIGIERVGNAAPSPTKNHHYHNSYEVYYLYSGERYYFIKDKTYHVKRGNLVLVKPYDIHCTNNFSKSGYDRCLIMFKRSFLEEIEDRLGDINLFECFDKGIHLIPLSFQEQAFVETLLSSMVAEFKADASGKEAFLKTAMVQLLLIATRHATSEHDTATSTVGHTHKTVSEAAAYINNNYKENITLNFMADKFFISTSYLSRTFKRITGISFTEYLNGVRVKEAQRLLATTDKSISAISEDVGYKSTTHFERSFKSISGMSPREYRRIKRKPEI